MLSGLTIRGRCLLAAGVAAAACSLALNERDLLRVAAFAAALPLLALFLSARTRVGLRGKRVVTPVRLPVHSEGSVDLVLDGRHRLPTGGLEVVDDLPAALGERPRFHLRDLPRDRPAALRYAIRPGLRGIHHIGPLRVTVSDPLGLSEDQRELAGNSRLVAVPEVVQLVDLPVGSGLGAAGAGSTRLRAGHGDDDSMLRQYRHGDDMRRVHWKSTAHRDELMVRAEERPWHGAITVLLDRRSAAHRGRGAQSSVEWAISAVASITTHLHRHGHQVRLVTQDGQTLSEATGWTGGGRDDDAVLDALAAVRPSTSRDLNFSRDPGDGRQLIAVLGAVTSSGVTELTKLRPQGAQSMAVLLDVRRWSGDSPDGSYEPQEAARRLRAAGWHVVIAGGPRTSVATAWSDLCRASSGSASAGSLS